MVNYAFDYLSSLCSLPLTTAATELSAIHGHSTSQYRLGEFYLHGSDGKPLDYTQARYWYEQSAEQKIRAHKANWGDLPERPGSQTRIPVKQLV